ncbi:hypothetical protein apy_01920 [Aeropyrum pernix]|uniref:Uncharacterized protein n=1 Tax=Aeropyrum pernix TaxID=56636 RepID=A0A401H7L2_AERPX|nr:hypothetical protein [Aeropyrum pernix]GBF08467.1 hypothetical protein apy_01920 [Aeropyrum pernix]
MGPSERVVKERLVKRLEDRGVEPGAVAEWLWEEFGIRVAPRWERVRQALMRRDVTPQDLVSLLDELGFELEAVEDAWEE